MMTKPNPNKNANYEVKPMKNYKKRTNNFMQNYDYLNNITKEIIVKY